MKGPESIGNVCNIFQSFASISNISLSAVLISGGSGPSSHLKSSFQVFNLSPFVLPLNAERTDDFVLVIS